jgi:cytochrome c553
MKPNRTPRPGRPPAGFNGEPVSRYPQLAARIPSASLEQLRALATRERRSMWRVLVDAIDTYARDRR